MNKMVPFPSHMQPPVGHSVIADGWIALYTVSLLKAIASFRERLFLKKRTVWNSRRNSQEAAITDLQSPPTKATATGNVKYTWMPWEAIILNFDVKEASGCIYNWDCKYFGRVLCWKLKNQSSNLKQSHGGKQLFTLGSRKSLGSKATECLTEESCLPAHFFLRQSHQSL